MAKKYADIVERAREQMATPYKSTWGHNEWNGWCRARGEDAFRIDVTPANRAESIRVAQAIVEETLSRGLTWNGQVEGVEIRGRKFPIRITEQHKRVEMEKYRHKNVGTGLMRVHIDTTKVYKPGPRVGPLIGLVPSMFDWMEQRVAGWERAAEERAKERAIEEEKKDAKLAEVAVEWRRRELLVVADEHAKKWASAQTLRNFAAAVRERHGERSEAWALVIEERATALDPLSELDGMPDLRSPGRSELINILREDPNVGYHWW